jgi:hypothetical protein
MKKGRINKIILGLMLVYLIFAVGVSADITYVENFEDDTVGLNPSASWYTYTETSMINASVSDEVAHDGVNCFLINDTMREAWTNYAEFQYDMQFPYKSFEFYFYMNDTLHNYSEIRLMDNGRTNTIVYINITDTNLYVNNSADLLPTIYGSSISEDTWYGIHIDFNWTDDTVFVELLNSAGTVLDDSNAWVDMGDPESGYDFTELEYINITQEDAVPVYLGIDGFTTVKETSSSTGGTTSSYSLNYLLIMALTILVLLLVWDLIKNPTLEVTLIVLFLVAVIIVTVGIEVVTMIG